MRSTLALASLAALLALSSPANAAPVNLAPVSFSPEFQTALDEELGAREGEHLRADLTRAVSRELTARGATIGEGGVTIELSIVDADPNRPCSNCPIDLASISFGLYRWAAPNCALSCAAPTAK